MNLFRAEEQARLFHDWDQDMEWSLQPLQWWATTFATPMFRNRGRSDFITWMSGEEGASAMRELRSRLSH
ncbi:MAG: hypothetical protein GWP30_12690 [Actinobacteria bacterium]|jgi:hypothetical protein|nr:hypothetical protein [Actinomycetota bacterium]NCG41818.1 hypothetical protein [Actinomycetota bacterium]|tara:strand:- start:656 stop:865 length:210 start_codon:yes stop_codon:yes gene_type:complete